MTETLQDKIDYFTCIDITQWLESKYPFPQFDFMVTQK